MSKLLKELSQNGFFEMGFYGSSSKTQLMERDMKMSETVIVFNYVAMLSNYVWHPQRSRELLECFIVSSGAKDCLVLPQYDLHHGTFLLVTPIVMSSYKGTII